MPLLGGVGDARERNQNLGKDTGMGLEAIVCILERGKANDVVKKAVEAGARGATIFFARGSG